MIYIYIRPDKDLKEDKVTKYTDKNSLTTKENSELNNN